MNIQEAIDAPRFHHQWLPDEINYETRGLSPDTIALLRAKGHTLREGWPWPSIPQGIVVNAADGVVEGGSDRRDPDGAAVGR
jgi:gamma-glutamyltranspeptidase/glutathione hydrolase